ncbi:NADH oxidoreductase hcr [Photorhabdus australis subsp. thailandensis]|uniref:NADH oxidoreductase hcr n=1 Tax=Photorhabdus australis subsp. thailandensis TaxID=2805096 RepID=A0A1C0U5H0_9GAMM|nr:NADH oxidoreductase hcr [Photorhabdus australis subsp. thailandensis]
MLTSILRGLSEAIDFRESLASRCCQASSSMNVDHPMAELQLAGEDISSLQKQARKFALNSDKSKISSQTVMTCGPAPYMKNVREFCYGLGVAENRFFMEWFLTEPEQVEDKSHLTMILLTAMENNHIPVMAACRTGVCGSCKIRIIRGKYTTSSTMTLTANEIANGYVLACSCQLRGDVVLE